MSSDWLVYDFRDYKEALQQVLKKTKSRDPQTTLRSLAVKVRVQYTYLSRVLNSKQAHLSEDQLYALSLALQLFPDEIEFLLLLRSYQTTEIPNRREAIFAKIENISQQKKTRADYVGDESVGSNHDLHYLLNPICVIIHVALLIKDYQKNPRLLCASLGISVADLRELLRILDSSGYIDIDPTDAFKVIAVKSKHPHFTRTHPLMRAHQSLLKNAMNGRLAQTSEEVKESRMVTFTANAQFFEALRKHFDEFMKEVQKSAGAGKHTHLYQLNFDFLRWL
jgi:uncharacterized protein (TIGR02147 family)